MFKGTIKNGKLTIEMDLNTSDPQLSKSEKTRIAATTAGFKDVEGTVKINGKDVGVKVSVTATVPANCLG